MIVASKIHQWILKLVGKSLSSKRIFAYSPIISPGIFIDYTGKSNNLTVEKPQQTLPNQGEYHQEGIRHLPPDVVPKRVMCLPKVHNLGVLGMKQIRVEGRCPG